MDDRSGFVFLESNLKRRIETFSAALISRKEKNLFFKGLVGEDVSRVTKENCILSPSLYLHSAACPSACASFTLFRVATPNHFTLSPPDVRLAMINSVYTPYMSAHKCAEAVYCAYSG
jgi:hypothetical protein